MLKNTYILCGMLARRLLGETIRHQQVPTDESDEELHDLSALPDALITIGERSEVPGLLLFSMVPQG